MKALDLNGIPVVLGMVSVKRKWNIRLLNNENSTKTSNKSNNVNYGRMKNSDLILKRKNSRLYRKIKIRTIKMSKAIYLENEYRLLHY